MGIFKDIFGKGTNSNEEKKEVPWIQLQSLGQVEELIKNSKIKPQLIFKHSTTCGISRMALNMFSGATILNAHQMDFYFLDIHSFRSVSNEVANRFQVRHESPQLLIIKNGVVVHHCSHGDVGQVNLGQHL